MLNLGLNISSLGLGLEKDWLRSRLGLVRVRVEVRVGFKY